MSRIRQSRQTKQDRRAARWGVTALAKDYPAGWRVPEHRHRRGQLMHAKSGVARVTTREGVWIVPPQRALWLPPGMPHEVRMEGDVAARTLYLDRSASAPLGACCKVLLVSKLLRELILAAVRAYGCKDAGRMKIMAPLLLHELQAADETGMCIPMPTDPRLARACNLLLGDASRTETLDQLAEHAGASSRTLARLFQRELKMTFRRWRQHVRLAKALSQIAAGASIKRTARDAGYASCSAFSAMFHRVLGIPPTQHLRTPPMARVSASDPGGRARSAPPPSRNRRDR